MKRTANILGIGITLLAFFYLVRVCLRLDFSVVRFAAVEKCLLWMGGFIVIYGFSLVLMTVGWWLILRFLTPQALGVTLRDAMGIYLRVNILKYLPGNVFQFVGRNFLARRYGISHGDLALSSLIEVIFLVITAVAVAAIFSFSELKVFLSDWIIGNFWLAFLIAAAVLAGLAFVAVHLKQKNAWDGWRRMFSPAFMELVLVLVFIDAVICLRRGLKLGVILVFLLGVPLGMPDWMHIIGIMSLAWTCGLITPGSPGGIGVREAVLFSMLSGSIPAGPLMMALALHRTVSIAGDGLSFGIAFLFPLKAPESVPAV
jgi:uncharacterized membrane protein YbhN (UPF0104 family)